MPAVSTVPVMSVSVGLLLVIVKVNAPSSARLLSSIDSTAVSLFTIVPKPLASPLVKVARVASVAPPNFASVRVTLKVSSSSTMLSSLTVTVTVSLRSALSPVIVKVAPTIAV